ncbi:Chitinase 2 [Elasticomyces elasticus]
MSFRSWALAAFAVTAADAFEPAHYGHHSHPHAHSIKPRQQGTFDPASKTNVAVYWGQGPNQARLLQTCQNPSVDIVNICFVNAFPDNSPGGWPGTNFANACGSQTYTHNGVATLMFSSCPDIGPDILACQQTYGKKVLLSLGGAYPLNYYIANDTSANSFADFVWGAFGPSTAAWTNAGNPRPFGDASVDGFDFDIESAMSTPPTDASGKAITDYQSRGYATMINRLKNALFATDTSKAYYIAGAPQCPLPDVHLSAVISAAWFDFLFVQFYNNPSCSARAAVNYAAGDSLLKWTQAASKNANVKIYMGLPASNTSVETASDYLTQAEVLGLVKRFSGFAKWGGISLWESTYSQQNVACNQDYTTWMKQIVSGVISGVAVNVDTKKCPVTTTTTSSTTTSASPTSSSGAAPAPGPTQSGIVSTCSTYLMANPGGSCTAFASRAKISLAQLYAWNSVLGPNGENCTTNFWANEYYCVAVRGGTTSVPTSTSTAKSTSTLVTKTSHSTSPTSTAKSTSTLLTKTSSSTTSTVCATPTLTTVTFNELKTTAFGESVYLVGDNAALGSWNTASAVALNAAGYTSSNPLWSAAVKLPVGTTVQYKYFKVGADGSVTWESDPNRSYTVPGNCAGTATEGDTWR